jgi:signal transduction histidine kinase
VGTFGISRDITERKRAEEALKDSLSLVEATLESTDNGILVISREGAVVKANGRFAEMWRIPSDILASGEDEKLLDHVLGQLTDPDAFVAKVKALYSEPGAESADLLEFKDGRVFERISKPMLVGGEPRARVWSFLDITERKRAEAEQAELEARSRQLQKAESLSRMAGAIAHHFNNQLQAVLLNLELAKGELLPDAGPARSVTEAMMAANLAAEMSELMLTYLGQTPGVRESLDLSLACSRWLSLLGVALPKHVGLKIDLASPGPTVRVDADQIRQVLTHLITNAWEAGGAGRSEVQVAVRAVTSAAVPLAHRVPPDWRPLEPAYACLEVVDHGCGVPEADIEKLFDPFFSSKFTGRGMGLAVVLGIVQAHGGAVTVDSTPGSGSAFRVYLPVSEGTGPVPS